MDFTIVEELEKVMAENEAVRAMWIAGSVAEGQNDELSDIDVWFDIADGKDEAIFGDIEKFLSTKGELDINFSEGVTPPYSHSVYHLAGMNPYHFIEITLHSHSNEIGLFDSLRKIKVLFDKDGVTNFKRFDNASYEKMLKERKQFLIEKIEFGEQSIRKEITRRQFLEALHNYQFWLVEPIIELARIKHTPFKITYGLKHGGSEGREAATGRGGVAALAELLKHESMADREITVAVQGFGNVGSYFATVAAAEHPSWHLIAASDTSAALTSENGLDASGLAALKHQRGRFKDYAEEGVRSGPANDIIGADVDVLVLAALGNSVTEENMRSVRAKYIVELANGPISPAAYEYLSKQGKLIIPDIIANAGGVIVSYLEWLQNKQSEHWPETRVNQELHRYMVHAMEELYRTAQDRQVSLKDAAYINALRRLATVS